MDRLLQIGGILLLAAAAGWGDQNKAAKAPPPVRNGAAPARAGAKNAAGGVPRQAPPLVNPANPVAQLYRASPEQRERVLEKLGPVRQEQLRKALADFDQLPKEEQQRRIQQAERFGSLPVEKQRAFRQEMQAFRDLPKDREQPVRQALRRVQIMSEEQRTAFFNSERFKSDFSPEEQKIIRNLSEVLGPEF